jgi:3-oxoadipate enol-lactonase
MTFVEANGGRFRVQLDGAEDAPCLVLSNSLGATLDMWAPQVEAFAQSFRLLRYDTRGHGGSFVTKGPYDIELLARDVLGLLDALQIQTASFCGLSMGGATGLWLAAHASARFERFVICNTVPWLGPPPAMLERAAKVRKGGLEPLAEATLSRWFTPAFRQQDPQAVERVRAAFLATPVEGYAACCEALSGYDVRGELARIDRPLLVVAGRDDPAPRSAAVSEYAGTIAGAQFVELDAAHLSNLGAAHAFNETVLRFLTRAT